MRDLARCRAKRRITRRASPRLAQICEHPALRSSAGDDTAAAPPPMIVRRGESSLMSRTSSAAAGKHSVIVHDRQTMSGA